METPSWHQQQYSPSLSVPEAPDIFARWAKESSHARATLEGHLDLAYGPGPKETLDLFPVAGSKTLVVFIHGGYWRAFDKNDFCWMVPPLVASGISVAMLNYELCPAVDIATIAEQCRRAVAWLAQHAQDYGVDSSRMVLSGHSAGGHLVGMLFMTDWAALGVPVSSIRGGISLSGLFDLEPLTQTTFNADLKLTPENAKPVSPILFSPTLNVPLISAAGSLESDEFRRQSLELAAKWPNAEGMLLEGYHHFNILEPLTDLNSHVWRKAKELGML